MTDTNKIILYLLAGYILFEIYMKWKASNE